MEKEQEIQPWYAIRVRTKFERFVADSLTGKGCEVYLPIYRSGRRWSDRVKDIDLVLFPGYLFCRFDVQKRLPVLTTPKVISIVGRGKDPEPIPDEEIGAIQTVIRSGLPVLPWPRLAAGTRVLIEHGPLRGIEGVAVQVKKKYRLFVSVMLLQRSVSIEIDRDWVRPLSSFVANRAEHTSHANVA